MIGDIYRLSVVGIAPQGQELVNVFYLQEASVLIAANAADDLIRAFRGEVETAYRATFSSGINLARYEARGVTVPTVGFDEALSPVLPGTIGGGEPLPPQAASLVSWRTGLVGRSFRGRTYLWPTSEAQQNGGQLLASMQTAIADFATALQTMEAGATYGEWDFGIYSQTLEVFTPVTSALVSPFVATQRRRRAGSGS